MKKFSKKMKKLVVIFGILMVLSLSVVMAKDKFDLSKVEKKEGKQYVREGVVLNLPTKKDMMRVVDSIDPITGAPTLALKVQDEKKNIQYKKFKKSDNEDEVEIEIPYVKDKDKDVLVYDPVNSLLPIAIPNSDEFLIAMDGNIYITDLKKARLEPFVKDTTHGYDRKEVESKVVQFMGKLAWAIHPQIEPSGKYLLFYTQREQEQDNYNGRMWVKNIQTGNEYPTDQIGNGSVIGWIDDSNVVVGGGEISLLNLESGKSQFLLDGGIQTVLVGDELVRQETIGTLTFYSINTGDKRVISQKLLNYCGNIRTHKLSIMMHNMEKHELLIYNCKEDIWKVIKEPENEHIQSYQWIDEQNVLINTMSSDGKMNEFTYTINIEEVEEVGGEE